VSIGTLMIRADASSAMGTGHVMRCLALAQAWRSGGGDAVFVMAESTEAIERRIQDEHFKGMTLSCASGSAEDARRILTLADEYNATWIAVDGYQFSPTYQRRIKHSDFQLLWIDDTGRCAPYCADIVLNQNVYATTEMYRESGARTTLLLGPRYALLRKEFLVWQHRQRHFAPVAARLLITMGGSDPNNATADILKTIGRAGLDVEVTIVLGGSNQNGAMLQRIAEHMPRQPRFAPDVKDMSRLMSTADLAISAAGATSYELALLQVPMVLVTLAENQAPTARGLAEHGAGVDLGTFQNLEPECLIEVLRRMIFDCEYRQSVGHNARLLVDGNGARRVAQAMLEQQQALAAPWKVQVGSA